MNAAERVTEGDIAPELVLKLNYAKALNAAPSGAQSDSVLGGWVSSFNRGPQECAIGLVLRGIFLDGTRIVTSWDNAARLWDAATGAELAVLQGPKVPLVSLAAYHDGTNVLILTVSVGPSAVVRDQEGNELFILQASETPGIRAAFTSDGARLVTASDDRTARLWDAATGQGITSIALDAAVTALAVKDVGKTATPTSWNCIWPEPVGKLKSVPAKPPA